MRKFIFSHIILEPCSPTCSLDIGVISATCIIPKCRPDQYVSGNSCEQCHASCQTCGGPGPNACLSCYSSIKLSNTNSCPGSKGKQVDETINGSLTGTYHFMDYSIKLYKRWADVSSHHYKCGDTSIGRPWIYLDQESYEKKKVSVLLILIYNNSKLHGIGITNGLY